MQKSEMVTVCIYTNGHQFSRVIQQMHRIFSKGRTTAYLPQPMNFFISEIFRY